MDAFRRFLFDGDGFHSARRANKSAGFTIVELLVCVGVITLLAAILLPAVGSARESAHHLQCTNHLKQLGLALHEYHEVNQCLPPGWRWDASQSTAFGWSPPLLPFLEQTGLFGQIDFCSSVGSLSNRGVRSLTPAVLLCPSDIVERVFVLHSNFEEENPLVPSVPLFSLPSTNYVGVFGSVEPDIWTTGNGTGSFAGPRPIRFEELQRGLSNVLLVGERRAATVESTWFGIDRRGEDAPCRILGNAFLGPNSPQADECEFTSRHPGLANFLWGDGHVKPVANTVDPSVYQVLARRDEF